MPRGLAFANNLLRFQGSGEQFVSDFNLLLYLLQKEGRPTWVMVLAVLPVAVASSLSKAI